MATSVFNEASKATCLFTKRSDGRGSKFAVLPICDHNHKNISSYVEGEVSHVSCLPDEILEHIFSFLNVKERVQTELVCKRWRTFGKTVPWRSPTEFKFKTDPKNTVYSLGTPISASDQLLLSVLARCGMHLRKLVVRPNLLGAWHSIKTLEIVGQNCPNLTELDLINVPMDSEGLETVSQNCPKLKTLRIRKFGNFYEEEMRAFLKKSQSLECLRIATCINYATGTCFDLISRKLTVLALMNCLHLQPTALDFLMNRCEHIQELRLSGCEQIDEDALRRVCLYYRESLKILQLDRLSQPINWDRVLPVLHNLETLKLCKCLGVDNDLIPVLAENCPRLKNLDIAHCVGISDAGLAYLVTFPNLTSLDISGIPISGTGIHCLALRGRLVKLRAASCDENMFEEPDECFGELAKHCPNLQVLDVSLNAEVTNELVRTFRTALATGCLKRPVKLLVRETMVSRDVAAIDGLVLLFDDANSLFMDEDDFQLEDEYEIEKVKEFLDSYHFFSV